MSPATTHLPTDLPAGAHCAPLTGLRLIQATGADAISFLHAQFTQDVQTLAPGQARLGAYCSAKGRMQASFVFWLHRNDDGAPCVRALVDAGLAETFLKRLRMFVLRAKVMLEILDADILGVWADHRAAAHAFAAGAGHPQTTPWKVSAGAGGTFIAAPLGGSVGDVAAPSARWWWVGDAPAGAAAPDASAPDATGARLASCAGSDDIWRAQDIAAGLPWITSELHELLTPQMANFDLIGGVSFTKGCYPGQEVVARSHYRGRVKRRTLLGRIEGDTGPAASAMAGADIYNGDASAEPVGRVVNAARTPSGGIQLLFEAPLDAGTAAFRFGAVDGPPVVTEALPYSLAADTR